MGKLLRRYLREQSSVPPEQDMVRAAAAQSGVDFDKLPPEIQTKLSDVVTKWGQNQTAYQQLSDREAQLATQIDALTNQPETPDKQDALNQLNNQLVSTRSGLDQVKASSAEIDAMGKEIEPTVTQLRDTGQAAAAPPDQTLEIPPPANAMAPAPAPQAQIAPEPVQPMPAPEGAPPPANVMAPAPVPQAQIAPEPVQPMPAPEGAPPPANAMVPEPQIQEPGPSQAPPEMHRGTLQNIPQAAVPAYGTPSQSAPPPPPTEPQFQEPGPSQAPEGAEGGMEDVAAGAAAVGIAGAAVMGAYKIYKQFFSKAARACANAPSKDECMQSYRDHGVQAAVNNLKRQIPKCGNDQDCAQKLQMAIKKLESNLGA